MSTLHTGKMVIFSTPGVLDLKSITHFGVNSKPNTQNPIGFFGTGLKYAISILTRMGCKITIKTGGQTYEISSTKDQFRSKEFDFLAIKRKTVFGYETTPLPFTTELGKTWVMWQAFRELYSNTLDEGGHVEQYDHFLGPVGPKKGETVIIVYSDLLADEYQKRYEYFLQDEKPEPGVNVQMIDRQSKYIYYRGLRVKDLPNDQTTALTYNIQCQLDLTEDRTAKYDFYVSHYIKQAISQSKDLELIEKALTAPKGSYETHLNFGDMADKPSKEFEYVARNLKAFADKGAYVNYSARTYADKFNEDKLQLWNQQCWQAKCLDLLQREEYQEFLGEVIKNIVSVKSVLLASMTEEPKQPEDCDGSHHEVGQFEVGSTNEDVIISV